MCFSKKGNREILCIIIYSCRLSGRQNCGKIKSPRRESFSGRISWDIALESTFIFFFLLTFGPLLVYIYIKPNPPGIISNSHKTLEMLNIMTFRVPSPFIFLAPFSTIGVTSTRIFLRFNVLLHFFFFFLLLSSYFPQ